jgi:hypothetical protein
MESSTAAAPAIPLEILLSNMQEYLFGERTVRMLQREPGLEELRYRSHQIYFVHDFALRRLEQGLSLRQLSRAFDCDAGRVKAALKTAYLIQKPAIVILPLMIRQNSKLFIGSESKPKNLTQSQGQACCTIIKRNFPLLFREGGSIFYVAAP